MIGFRIKIHKAFSLVQDINMFRDELTMRCYYLVENCIEVTLKRFILAVVDENKNNEAWLESIVMVIMDKPAEKFTDNDILAFDMKLQDLNRRFNNLELLQKRSMASKDNSFIAKRITISEANGNEIDQIIRYNQVSEEYMQSLIEKKFNHLAFQELSLDEKKILLLKLCEKIFENQNEIKEQKKIKQNIEKSKAYYEEKS